MNTVTKTTLQSLALASTLIFFTACGGGSSTKTASVDATVTTTDDGNTTTAPAAETIDTKTRALNIITEYAQTDGGSAVPVAQTYAYAGVVGVGTDNVTEFNVVIAGQASSEVDTTEELQVLLNALGESAEPIAPIGPVTLAPGVEIPDSLFPHIPGIPTGPTIPTSPTPTIPTIPVPTIPIPGI